MSDAATVASENAWPQRFAAAIAARYGEQVVAVILYGSWLRGKRDTVLDFYVLLDSYAALDGVVQRIGNRILPPNVYNIVLEHDGETRMAKYATVTLAHFERAIARDFHSYFWARFIQPTVIVHARDDAGAAALERCRLSAARRVIDETVPLMGARFSSATFWQRAFALTYGCELRSENQSKACDLAATYAEELKTLLETLADACELRADGPQHWRASRSDAALRRAAWRWRVRRAQGKVLSVARLIKAAFTFNEPLEYLLWKVERHSGVREESSALQRRHPLLFSWGLLWRLYRRGGFR